MPGHCRKFESFRPAQKQVQGDAPPRWRVAGNDEMLPETLAGQ
jgi:hypothetical protein